MAEKMRSESPSSVLTCPLPLYSCGQSHDIQPQQSLLDTLDPIVISPRESPPYTTLFTGSTPPPKGEKNYSVPPKLLHSSLSSQDSIFPPDLQPQPQTTPGPDLLEMERLQVSPHPNRPMSWEEALVMAKAIGEPIIRAARQAQGHDTDEDEEDGDGCNEALAFLRDGPATEIDSEVYKKLIEPIHMPGVEKPEEWYIHPPTSIRDPRFKDEDPDVNWRTQRQGTQKFLSQWTTYDNSQKMWPQLLRGDLKFVTHVDEKYNYTPRNFPLTVTNPPGYIQHDFNCNWYFTPRINWNHQGYQVWFWQWLVKIPMKAKIIDIYHRPFFDGTCSPDGGYSLMIQDIEHLPAPRDMSDEQTRLHWHETSAGYMYNLDMKLKGHFSNPQRDQQIKSQVPGDFREVFRQMSDRTHASTYLRPVEVNDVDGLIPIFNWYAKNSTLSPYSKQLEGREIRSILENCRLSNLPFIVAVISDGKNAKDPEEKIVGYAYIKEVNDFTCGQNTGELHVFVSPDFTRKSIGWGLIHMILSIVDTAHSHGSPRYQWKPTTELPYDQGSMRPLHKLVCLIAYPVRAQEHFGWAHSWTAKWLKQSFGFQEQGILKSARYKFNLNLDVLYLFRNISLPTPVYGPAN
ncbi:hypothetical protein N7456_007323 [Penicillium angulare]|uniref:Acyl-CoA N-acyltransferase n=1 Tax=Penicillium angulare TaxID=116970 RepID=A0A9W9K945_9EURO|nr:hypothetical protein N7456_007323 [Penicillium angulare]